LPDCYMVRNTFIESKPERSESLERFLEERKCRSSPTSRPPSRPLSRQASQNCLLDMEDPFNIATPTGSAMVTPRGPPPSAGRLLSTPPTPEKTLPQTQQAQQAQQAPNKLRLAELISNSEADAPSKAAARLAKELRDGASFAPKSSRDWAGSAAASTAAPSSLQGSAIIMGTSFTGSAASSNAGSGLIPGAVAPAAMGLDASRAGLFQNKLGSIEVPSRGSALHPWGACKPCAFVFQDGCANGVECEFCHLCEPGERKRRKKERRKMAAGWRMAVLQR